jgi:hypothetical protein
MFRCWFSPAGYDSNLLSKRVSSRLVRQLEWWPDRLLAELWALYIAAVGKAWSLLSVPRRVGPVSVILLSKTFAPLKPHTLKILWTFLKRVNMILRQCFVPMIHPYKQYKFRMGDLKFPPICNRAMRCFAASSGNFLPKFRDHNGPIFMGPDRYSRNVGKKFILLSV